MLDQIETDDLRVRMAEVEAQRVPLGEVARWFTPWALAGILVLIFIGGLWCAASAVDGGTYAVGLIGAALAFGAMIWEFSAALGGRPIVARGDGWLVEDETSVVILVALLVILAVVGLVLAARAASVAANGAGYGLCIVAIVFICLSLKHYFDRRAGDS